MYTIDHLRQMPPRYLRDDLKEGHVVVDGTEHPFVLNIEESGCPLYQLWFAAPNNGLHTEGCRECLSSQVIIRSRCNIDGMGMLYSHLRYHSLKSSGIVFPVSTWKSAHHPMAAGDLVPTDPSEFAQFVASQKLPALTIPSVQFFETVACRHDGEWCKDRCAKESGHASWGKNHARYTLFGEKPMEILLIESHIEEYHEQSRYGIPEWGFDPMDVVIAINTDLGIFGWPITVIDRSMPHPNISATGKLCIGNRALITDMMRSREFREVTMFITSLLSRPCLDDPYMDWMIKNDATRCQSCMNIIPCSEREICERCRESFCSSCVHDFEGHELCETCITMIEQQRWMY